MTKLLFTGDWHLRGTSPRNRLDDYKEAAKLKILELFEIADYKKVDAIIVPGDIWDRPDVGISILISVAELLRESPVPIKVTPGNHDIYGYNISTYERSSLKLLELLVPQLEVILDPLKPVIIGDTVLSFQPYASEVDVDGYGYDMPTEIVNAYPDLYFIKVTHGYMMLNKPVWDKYTLIENCHTMASLVVNGHDHTGHGVFTRNDGTVFCNPGALMRKEATKRNQERDVEVVLLEVHPYDTVVEGDGKGGANFEVIKLKTAKPGTEILDRSSIESENARREAMDSFKMLLEAKTGGMVIADIDAVVEQIAKAEGMAPEVVEIALNKIHAVKEV